MNTRSRDLRRQLISGLVVAPTVYDGFTARIAERAGLAACFLSEEGTAAQLGLREAGLVSLSEMVDNLRYVVDAVIMPVIAAAGTGFGNTDNVARTVREYELAGAAGLDLGDHTPDGADVVAVAEAVAKLGAALEARSDPDFVIIARTRALGSRGWDEALRRVDAYRDAGVDLVFVDGIGTADDLSRYARDVASAGPAVYHGPVAPVGDIRELGFAVYLAGDGHRASARAVQAALTRVRDGLTEVPNWDRLDFEDVTALLGLNEVYDLEARYATVTKGD